MSWEREWLSEGEESVLVGRERGLSRERERG